jgi:Glycosyltransferase family 10 (fucosyltransferase) C-term
MGAESATSKTNGTRSRPYRYSLAIENSNSTDYWAEKVADCFLSWTVPLYDGCLNLEDYFRADSFIRIDASDHAGTLRRIEELLLRDESERRLPAVAESRNRMLREYQMFPALARAIHTYGTNMRDRELVSLPGYRSARWKHRTRYLAGKIREGDAADLVAASVSKLRYFRWLHLG